MNNVSDPLLPGGVRGRGGDSPSYSIVSGTLARLAECQLGPPIAC